MNYYERKVDYKMLFVPKGFQIGPVHIAFYAICIIIGAITTYKLAQHFLKKKGFDPNAIENLFYIAFPAGIVGARIWWMIAENQPFEDFYKIYEGGLAIQGGVLFGALVGFIFMIKRRPNIPVLLAADCIVPSIAIAQAIGRWGNFFNQEVYGYCVDRWTFLPNFITDRLSIALNANGTNWATTNYNGSLFAGENGYYYLCEGGANQMVLPLFLIEGVLNVIGFFVLMFGIPAIFKLIKKKFNKDLFADGDLMCGYLIWYGIIRFILEPMRNEAFIMGVTDGSGNANSQIMSIVFVVLGVVGIVLCHLYKHFFKKDKVLETNVISGSEADKNAVSIAELKQEETEKDNNETKND